MSQHQAESVVIVGGGIIGLACAHYLSSANLRVTVIERGRIAGACSHANCGYISPSHVLPLTEPGAISMALKSLLNPDAPFRVRPRWSPAMWNWMWQFARRCTHRNMVEVGAHLKSILDASMSEYRKLMAAESLDCQWKDSGLLYVFQSERGFDEFAETVRLLSESFGVDARRIDGDELTSLDPAIRGGLPGAFLFECDSYLRPDALAVGWSSALRDRGVTLIENCELRSIESSRQRTDRILTSDGPMEADRYVFAAGAWSQKWSKQLRCRVPVQPGKGYSVTMSRPDPCPQHPMLFPEHKVGVTPFDDGYRLGSMMEFTGYDTSIPPRRIEQLRRSAEPYLVCPHTEQVRETWYGWRPMTWDSLPIIGPVPRNSNSYLATGHNMLGMSLAASTGRLVAEIVCDQPTHIDAKPYSPMRFD